MRDKRELKQASSVGPFGRCQATIAMQLLNGKSGSELEPAILDGVNDFMKLRERFMLYAPADATRRSSPLAKASADKDSADKTGEHPRRAIDAKLGDFIAKVVLEAGERTASRESTSTVAQSPSPN